MKIKEVRLLKKGDVIHDNDINLDLRVIGTTPSGKYIELESLDTDTNIHRDHFYMIEEAAFEACKIIECL